jgi:hypothetical protein
MTRRQTTALTVGTVVILVTALLYMALLGGWYRNGATVLLVGDDVKTEDPRVQVWVDAAREEGLRLRVVRDSDFLRPWFPRRAYAGVIVPDQVHRAASDFLTQSIKEYVATGGRIMLVYDAVTLDAKKNAYPKGKARLSDLVGVDYALYDELRDATIQWDAVVADAEMLERLQLPPGKYTPIAEAEVAPRHAARRQGSPLQVITSYRYPVLRYPSFVTRGDYAGRALLRSLEHTLVAGERNIGTGRVLFVNLPLGYLKGQTDGALLHGFLRYYADVLLEVPRLASVPDGVGGLVLNWHLDSNAALPALQESEVLGMFRHGPYSIHVTAGPDASEAGDGLGINAAENREFQTWLRDAAKRHAIGSHGGWIHDYFALHLPPIPNAEFEKYLALNKEVLETITAQKMAEYSAPSGNHPEWVTQWLEERGVRAYYFTGNVGMGATRSYREGVLRNRKIWSFPFLSYRHLGGFEEMSNGGVPDMEAARWLRATVDFVAQRRAARLLYLHPTGVAAYQEALQAWLQYVEIGLSSGRFRLYTMTQLADFLSRREEMRWGTRSYFNGTYYVTADHPDSLAHQTWLLPRKAYGRPVIDNGQATIAENGEHWIVVAGEGKHLRFYAER